ncbi:hypothetical protein [Microbulbifer taiwanensis]|uniref:hypothetical protein n=1 Tax=Microbulbifer taiwanensis TaxID=986746 RepID=UPI00360D9129
MLFSSFSGVNGARQVHEAFVKSFYDEFFPRDLPAVTPPADFSERAQRYAGNYLAWRGNFTKAESLARLLSVTQVEPQIDGTLLVGKKRYVEVGENLFREVNDYGRIAFQENEQGEISGFVIDGKGVNQMYRAPLYESPGFTFALTGLSLLLFAGVFLRLGYQWSAFRALHGIERNAFSASIALATFNFLFVILFTVAIASSTTVLAYELPTLMKVSLLFPLLAAAAALYHLYCAVQLWRQKCLSGTWARVRYSLVTLCGLFMLWFYWYWNLLGFQYH